MSSIDVAMYLGLASIVVGISVWLLKHKLRFRGGREPWGFSQRTELKIRKSTFSQVSESKSPPVESSVVRNVSSDSTTTLPLNEPVAPVPVPVRVEKLVVGDWDDPLIEVFLVESPTPSEKHGSLLPQMISNLQPILTRAPELLRAGRDLTNATVRLVFSPEVTKGLQNGTFVTVKDAAMQLVPVARDTATGRFVEVGKVVSVNGIRLANVAVACWQVAAIATAQHYLSEINERLKNIEDGVADIRFFQIEDRRTELQAAIVSLREYFDAISRGDLHANEIVAIYQRLEFIDGACLHIGGLARGLSFRHLEKLRSLKVRENMGRAESARRFTAWLKEYEEIRNLNLLAHSCRLLGCKVKAMLPGDRAMLKERVLNARNQYHAVVDSFSDYERSFYDRVSKLTRRWGIVGQFDADYASELRERFKSVLVQAKDSALKLERLSDDTLNFTKHFDRIQELGMVIEADVGADGGVTLLSVKAD